MHFIVSDLIINGITIPAVIASGTDLAYYLAHEYGSHRETYRIVNLHTGEQLHSGLFYHQTCQQLIGIAARVRVAVFA